MYNLFVENSKKILVSLLSIMVIFLGLTFLIRKENKSLTEHQKRLKLYDQVQTGDEDITGTDYIKFDAFFLEDLNNDGTAESIRGNSLEIGDKGELYLELKVLGDVKLTNAKISFINSNSRVSGSIKKGSLVSENQSSTDFSTIKLKELNNGVSTLTKLTVESNLTNDLNSYSGINKVKLTGTVTDLSGNVITDIEKEVPYTVDWHGDKLTARVSTNTSKATMSGHTPIISYKVTSTENEGQLFLKTAYLEVKVSNLTGNGINLEPVSVVVNGPGIVSNYDSATHTLTARRDATLNDTLITSQAYSYKNELVSYNEWDIIVTYDDSEIMEDTYANITATAWYDAFNNQGTNYDNVKTSDKVSKVQTATIRTNGYGQVNLWDTVNSVDISTVNKVKAMNLYNGSETDDTKDDYNVNWTIYVPSIINDGNKGGNTHTLVLNDNNGDKFNNTVSMKDYTTYKSIKLTGLDNTLNTTGSVVLVDADTNEVLHVFTALNWNDSYTFEADVRSIKLRANGFKQIPYGTSYLPCGAVGYCNFRKQLTFNVIATKTIDNEAIANNISFADYDEFSNITSEVNAISYNGDNQIGSSNNKGTEAYKGLTSDVYITANKSQVYTTEETDVEYTISTNNIDELARGFKNGEFYVVFPSEILDVKLNNVVVTDPDLTITLEETGKLADSRNYIKINTANDTAKKISFKLDTTIVPNPTNMGSTPKVELYGYNPDCHNYVHRTEDIYDINTNNDTNEKVAYAAVTVNLTAPNEMITTSTLKEYNNANNTSVAPMVAEVNPVEDDPEATVEVSITNNSEFSAKNVRIIGKVAYDDNTYQIGTGSLGSKYDVHMTDEGIKYPSELNGHITIYYSEEEAPTDDVNNAANGWKLKDATDFTKVKTYMIVLNDYDMEIGKSLTFTYDIEMPMTTANLNKATYFTHGVYYDLVTNAGLHASSVGGSKLGIRMSRQYDVEITNFKKYSTKTISGTKYLLEDEDGNQKLVVTNNEGKVTLKDLYVGVEYTLKQVSINDPYIIDEETKTFKLVNGANDEITLESNGTLKSIILTNNKKVTVEQENETRYNLVLSNKDFDTDAIIVGSKFKITGKGYETGKTLRTNSAGNLELPNLYLNQIYEVEQVNANNYLLTDKFTFVLTRDTNNEIKISYLKQPVVGDILYANYMSQSAPGYITVTRNYASNAFANIPVDLTGLTGKYRLEANIDYAHYYSSGASVSMYVKKGDCDGSSFGVANMQYLYYSAGVDYSGVASTEKAYNSGNYNLVDITGGNKYCIIVENKYSNLSINGIKGVALTNPQFETVNEIVNVATVDNVNALQSLNDNNIATPVLNVTVKNKKVPTYNFEITKVDAETNEPLAGAQYKITGPGLPDGGKYLTTDANGKATVELRNKMSVLLDNNIFKDVIINNVNYVYDSQYKIEEVTAPVGYTLDNRSYEFSNRKYYILRSGSYTTTTAGTYFTFDEDTTEYNYTVTFGQNSAEFDNPTWDDSTNTLKVTMKDYPIVKLVKKDAETGEILPNTLFAIYSISKVNGVEVLTPATDANGNIIGNRIELDNQEYYVVETDENGKINFNLGTGQYKIIEVQAADEKYELSSSAYVFGVGETVPYQKTAARMVDFVSAQSFSISNSSQDDYIATSDGGFAFTDRNRHLIKYDKNLNKVFDIDIDFEYSNSHTEYYYQGNLVSETRDVRRISSSSYKKFKLYDALDGGIIVSAGETYHGIAKFDKNGQLVWTNNTDTNWGYKYNFTGICSFTADLNADGKVPVTSKTGSNEYTNYYTPDYMNQYYSYLVIDADTYYCGIELVKAYADLDATGIGVDLIPTADGGVYMLPQSYRYSYNDVPYIIELADGTEQEIHSKYLFLKYNNQGKPTNVYDLSELLEEADQAYVAKYSLSSGIYSSSTSVLGSNWGYRYFGMYPNGDILIVGGYSGNPFAIKLRYNSTTDKFETVFYTPLGVNGDSFKYSLGYSSQYKLSVSLLENGGFSIQTNSSGGIPAINNTGNAYYNTELQKIGDATDDLRLLDGQRFSNGVFIYEYDGTGKISNLIITAQQNNNQSLDPADVYEYDSLRYLYPTYTHYGYRQPNGNYIVSSQGQYSSYGNNKYIKLSTGEIKNILEGLSSNYYLVAEFSKEHQVEWMNRYTGINPSYSSGYTNPIIPIDGGKKVLIPIQSTGDITELETGNVIQTTAGNGFLVLELSDEIPASGPEAYTLNIDNSRKEYKITATSNVGGEITVTNPDNGQTVVTSDGSTPEILERVKYGDDNKYEINIKTDPGYVITSVKVNGEEASYKVNDDYSITLDTIKDIKENKNISITYDYGLSQVIVKHYLNGTTDSVFGDEILTGQITTPYKAEPKSDYLYSLASNNGEVILPDNMEGTYTVEPQTVVFYYVENEVDLKVNYYVDGTETELAPSNVQRKTLGSRYQTAPLDIEFYNVSRTIGNESGTLTRNLTEVTYMYSQNNEAKITIRYVDKATNQDIITPITKTVQRHDPYTTDDPVTIPGKYRLASVTGVPSGTAEDAEIEVIYYYEEIPFNVSVDKKINSVLLNGEKQTITNGKNVSISPAKKDNLIVYYEINLKNTGDIKANFKVVEGEVPGFVIYDMGNFVKTTAGYELTVSLDPGEEKTYRIGYKWNQKDYGISTNKVELTEVTNPNGFAEPDALDNISTATVETKVPKDVLGATVPNTIDNLKTFIMLFITSMTGLIISLVIIRKRRMN